ncbi:MAG: hypothetical protein MI673_10935, partial [Thiotrichales bacterium]|nr:hypothetical protein [Thiotrichales bacterium]
YFENTSQNEFSTVDEEYTVTRVEGSMTYRFSRHLTMNGGYVYREIERPLVNESQNSNQVYLNLKYDFDKLGISR